MSTIEGFSEMAAGATRLQVRIRRGDVRIETSSDNIWQLNLFSDRYEVPEVSRDGDVLRVKQSGYDELQHNPPRLDLKLLVPEGTEDAEIDTGFGLIDIQGLAATSRLRTGNGALALRHCGGEIQASSGHGNISIEDCGGDIQTRTGNGNIRAERLTGNTKLDTGNGSILVRDAESVNARSGNGDVTLKAVSGDSELYSGRGKLSVEDSAGKVKAHTGNGDIVLSGGQDELQLRTGHGRIEVGESGASSVAAHSGAGDIYVRNTPARSMRLDTGRGKIVCTSELEPGDHKLHSGNGDIHVSVARGEVNANTGQGSVQIEKSEGALRAHSGSGDITLGEASGEAHLDTGRGRITVQSPRSLSLQAHSGNGDIRIDEGTVQSLRLNTNWGKVTCQARPDMGDHEIYSGNGDLEIHLPSDISARIDAQTGSGQINSDFPMVRVGRSGGAGGARMVASIGDGGANLHLSLHTGRGQINLIRRSDSTQAARGTESTGYRDTQEKAPDPHLAVLEAVARGDLSVQEADELLQEYQ